MMEERMAERVLVPAREGRSVRVAAGQYVTFLDVEGMQIGDIVLLSGHDPHERFSQSDTRLRNGKLRISTGDVLYGTAGRPMAMIVRDDVGTHDIVSYPCDSARYERDFFSPGHANCRANLAGALLEYGVEEWWVPDPFNVFMNTHFTPDGRQIIEDAVSKAGDRVTLRAEMDLIVAVSACPQDMYSPNGYRITDLEMLVHGP
jgi:uncharacterized protein YcgI (DUF1989 family)